jgi:hypothetical protein
MQQTAHAERKRYEQGLPVATAVLVERGEQSSRFLCLKSARAAD